MSFKDKWAWHKALNSTTAEAKTITANGTYTAPSGKAYTPVTVNVPSEEPDLVDVTINANGTYTHTGHDGYDEVTVSVEPTLQDKTITVNGTYGADTGYDGLDEVVVNVPNPSTGSLSITSNNTYDVTNYASAVVNVSSGGGTHKVTLKNNAYYAVCGQLVLYNSTEYYTAGDVIDVADGDSITLYSPYSVTIDGVASTTITTYTPTCDCTISFNAYYVGEGTYRKLYYIATNGYYYLEDITITTNGTYEADDYYDGLGTVTVDTASLTAATVTITASSGILYYTSTTGSATSLNFRDVPPTGEVVELPLNTIVYITTSVTVTGMTALTTNVYRVTSTTATIS